MGNNILTLLFDLKHWRFLTLKSAAHIEKHPIMKWKQKGLNFDWVILACVMYVDLIYFLAVPVLYLGLLWWKVNLLSSFMSFPPSKIFLSWISLFLAPSMFS